MNGFASHGCHYCIYIWKSPKDFKCLKQVVQNIITYTQLTTKILVSIKQSKSMWYNHFNRYLKWDVYITLFVYAYSLCWIFVIVIVYVEHWILLELLKSLQE